MWKKVTTLLLSLSASSLWADNCRDKLPLMPANERFVVQTNGTVEDKKTRLMWKLCLEGLAGSDCRDGRVKKDSWYDAMQYVKNAHFAGYSDWRLPDLEDLSGISAQKCDASFPAFSAFPDDKNQGAWSSESSAYNENYAWYIHFTTSKSSTYIKSSSLPFRLVRQSD